MPSYKKSKEEMSLDVYQAFQTIGVTSDMILRRRHDFLLVDTLRTRKCWLNVFNRSFIVGSQVEGSTTLGMQSDIDVVTRKDNVKVVLKVGAWHQGKINLLAFKDKTTPPQFYKICRLQSTKKGRQEDQNCTC